MEQKTLIQGTCMYLSLNIETKCCKMSHTLLTVHVVEFIILHPLYAPILHVISSVLYCDILCAVVCICDEFIFLFLL